MHDRDRLTISYFDTNLSLGAKLVSVKGKDTEVLLSLFFVIAALNS